MKKQKKVPVYFTESQYERLKAFQEKTSADPMSSIIRRAVMEKVEDWEDDRAYAERQIA